MSATLMQTWGYDFSSKTEGQFPIDLYYTINTDQKSVTVTQGPSSYAGNLIEIPATVTYEGKEYTVTTIGYKAFRQTKITEVIMPNTITEIESYAFDGSDVGSITFSKNLKKIGDYAFNSTNLQQVELFEGLETIGKYAFHGGSYQEHIKTLTLPNTLLEIGESAFAYNAITFLKIPDNIEEIKSKTFESCNLDSVVLPSKLRIIGESAFHSCTSLRYIKFPNTVIEIGQSAFSGCSGLLSVTLPDNVQIVGNRAFSGCSQLVDFTFSAGMKEIPEYCLSYASKLINVTIPEGIEKIGLGTFDHCTLLSHVTFPESATQMEEMIFLNSGITSVTFSKNLNYLPGLIFGECYNLQEISIPEHIDSIGAYAFRSCSNLKNIKLPKNLKTISKGLLNACSNLEEITLPDQIQSIGESAFQGCSKIKSLIIPQTVLEIGQGAFSNMTSLKSMELPPHLKTITQGMLSGCTSLSNIYIPESVETIHSAAFTYTALEEVTIPHSVSVYAKGIFGNCKYLKALHIQRSTPPTINGTGSNPSIIDEGSQCILYVPRGSKATWDAADAEVWGRFKEIVEEDVPDVLYAIQIQQQGSGTVYVNSEKVSSSQPVEVAKGNEAVITFEPNVNYMLKSVFCNGKDVTDEVENLTYTIKDIQQNMSLDVLFAEKPLSLKLQTSEGGTISVPVEKNQTFTCQITPEEGWNIHSVYYNGLDVTDQVDEEGNYTTPSLTNNAQINVTFELETNIQSQTVSAIKVHVDPNGYVIIEGMTNESTLSLFSTNGTVIETRRTNQSNESIQLPEKGVYLLKVNSQTFKLSY